MPGVISPTPSSSNSTRPLPRSLTKRSYRSRFSREGRGHIAINENRLARSIECHGLAVVEHGVRGVFAGVCDLSEHVLYDAVAQSYAQFKEKNLLIRVRIEPVGYLAVLLFVHSVQGNLAVNRLLGWRRGPEFAHAQELLSAYSEGACERYRLVTISVVDLDCGLLKSLARDRAETGPCRIGAMATKNVARRRRRRCLRWGRARWRFGTVCFIGFAGR